MLARIRTIYPLNLVASLYRALPQEFLRRGAGLAFLAWAAFVLGKYLWSVVTDPPPSMRAAVVPYPHLWLLMILAVVGAAATVSLSLHTWRRPVAVRWRYASNALGVTALVTIALGLRYHPGDSALGALQDLAADDSMLLSSATLFLALGLATYFLVRRLLGLGPLEVPLRWVVTGIGGAYLLVILLAQVVFPVLGLLWILLAGWLIGDAILARFFPVRHLLSHERILLALGLGLGGIAQALFFPGIAGLLYKWPVLLALAVIALLRWGRIVQAARSLQAVWRDMDQRLRIDGVLAILGALTFVVALINFIAALAPELQSDAIGMHLALPKLWIQTYRLQTLDRINRTYWTMHNLHMLYTLGMWIHGPVVAKLLHYTFGLLDLGLIYALGRRLINRWAGVLAAVVFYSSSIVWWESGTAYVDLAYVFYVLATVLSLLVWLDWGDQRLLVLAGIMGGLGTGVKVLGGLVFIPALLVVALRHLRWLSSHLKALVVDGLVLVGAGLISNATWWAFAEFHSDTNRFWPAIAALLKLTSRVEQVPIAPGTAHFGIGTDWASLLRLPWALSFQPERFGEVGTLGVGLLVLGVALILRPRFHGREGYLFLICLVLSYSWAVTRQNIRYALPMIALWSIVAAAAFVRLTDWIQSDSPAVLRDHETAGEHERRSASGGRRSIFPVRGLRWSLALLVAVNVVFGFQIWSYAGQSSPGFPYLVVFGFESERAYLSRRYPLYDSIAYLNERYGDQVQVLAPFNRDNFYPEFVLESWAHATLGPYIDELLRIRSPEAFRQMLRARGYTHFILDETFAVRMMPQPERRTGTPLDTQWLDRVLSLEFVANGVYVYRVPFLSLFPTVNASMVPVAISVKPLHLWRMR